MGKRPPRWKKTSHQKKKGEEERMEYRVTPGDGGKSRKKPYVLREKHLNSGTMELGGKWLLLPREISQRGKRRELEGSF